MRGNVQIQFENYIRKYWSEINRGKVKVSKKVNQQMKMLIDLLDEIDTGNSKWDFDIRKANRPISFIETFCIHVKGRMAGKRYKLETWQKAIIQALFGIVHKETRFRRYRELHLFVGRKNSKTLLATCIMIYLMFKDGELGAECYSAATKRDQAAISWNMAKQIILKGPLRNYFHTTVNGIYIKPYRDSFWQPVSKESRKLDGLNPHAVYVDELHAIVDDNMIDVLKDGMTARTEPVFIITTTMGIDRLATFDNIYDYDEKVLNGTFEDERKLIFCYELDSESEWDDLTALQKANPNMGISKPIEEFVAGINEVKNDPNKKINFLCKTCNVRQTGSKSWLTFEEFNNETVVDLNQFNDTVVIGGFDLSRTNDLTAFTTLLFDRKNKKIIAETMYWITRKYYHENKKEVPFEKWLRAGYLRLSGDELIDYHDIANYVYSNVMDRGWKYQYINYDSYSANYLIEEMVSLGFAKKYVLIDTPQGFKTLSIPMQVVEADLRSKTLSYQNNPITKWCLSNVELVIDRNGNYMPNKANSKRKIDGAATILNCYVSYCNYKDYFMSEE